MGMLSLGKTNDNSVVFSILGMWVESHIYPHPQILLLLVTFRISKLIIVCDFAPPYEVYLKMFLNFLDYLKDNSLVQIFPQPLNLSPPYTLEFTM